MNYDRKKLGEELKLQLKKGYDIVRISRWAYTIFSNNRRFLDPSIEEILQYLFLMEDDPQFEYTEEELTLLAENLKELVRYIHLNPVRANLVASPEEYVWSSHRAYMNQDELTWLTQDRLLKRFHHDPQVAIRNYEKYVMKGIGHESEVDFKVGCQEGVLGDDGFIDEIKTKVCVVQKQKIELLDLIAKICERYELTKEDLCSSGKQHKQSRARAILALLVRESSNLSLEQLSRFLRREASGLSKLANRLEIECSQKSKVAQEVGEMRERIGNFT